MPNALAHGLSGGLAAFAATAYIGDKEGAPKETPLLAALVGGTLGSLPDILDPPIHPNHRKIFHSVLMLGVVAYGGVKLYRWETETDSERWLRYIALAIVVAYVAHLVLDARTKRSLPLMGL